MQRDSTVVVSTFIVVAIPMGRCRIRIGDKAAHCEVDSSGRPRGSTGLSCGNRAQQVPFR
jgi:hypothetical protein